MDDFSVLIIVNVQRLHSSLLSPQVHHNKCHAGSRKYIRQCHSTGRTIKHRILIMARFHVHGWSDTLLISSKPRWQITRKHSNLGNMWCYDRPAVSRVSQGGAGGNKAHGSGSQPIRSRITWHVILAELRHKFIQSVPTPPPALF